MNGVLNEISCRVRELREAGDQVLPPALLLGVMERAGASWLSGAFGNAAGRHDEPFGQQVCPAHPLSPLNPGVMSMADAERRLGPYGRHALVTFAVSKHAPQRQVITESSLFFALPALLALFPDSPAAVLTRSPVGVASAFAHCDLFRRWGYRARYRQLSAVTRRAQFRQWADVVPDDDPPDLAALARLQILNTLILAAALHGRAREVTVIGYESAVAEPDTAARALAAVVPASRGLPAMPGQQLTASLHPREVEEISEATARALAAGREAVPAQAFDLAREWASGAHLYSLTPPPARSAARRPSCPRPAGRALCPVAWVPGHAGQGLLWRNLLVTNDEFAAFLNELAQAGLPSCADGSYLLACEMPHERGGRLRCDPRARWWTVSPGFGGHPAYWVTWIGAAAFAARSGARLPARDEIIAQSRCAGLKVPGQLAGDAMPAAEPGRGAGEIHHLAGNLQVWCCDGPGGSRNAPALRWLHGAPAGIGGETRRPRARHISSAARDVGIRLVRDRAGQPAAASAAEIAAMLNCWLGALGDRSRQLGDLDESIAAALTRRG